MSKTVYIQEKVVDQIIAKYMELYNIHDIAQRKEFLHHVMSEIVSTEEFREYMYSKVRAGIESSYYDIDVDFYYDVVEKDGVLSVEFTVKVFAHRKYFEISNYCGEKVSEYFRELIDSGELSEDDITNEMIDNEYNECMDNMLEEINGECVRYIELKYTDYEKEYKIESEIVECDGDYCRCGVVFYITAFNVSLGQLVYQLERVLERALDVINVVL